MPSLHDVLYLLLTPTSKHNLCMAEYWKSNPGKKDYSQCCNKSNWPIDWVFSVLLYRHLLMTHKWTTNKLWQTYQDDLWKCLKQLVPGLSRVMMEVFSLLHTKEALWSLASSHTAEEVYPWSIIRRLSDNMVIDLDSCVPSASFTHSSLHTAPGWYDLTSYKTRKSIRFSMD